MGVVRRLVKASAAAVFHYTGLRRAMCAVRRATSGGRRVTIVGYHRVVEDFFGERSRSIPGLLVSKETFRRHLEEAHKAGYELASMSDAVDVIAGRRRATKDLFVVTFDDGYRDVVRHAIPILERMSVPAVVYLPTGYVGTARRFTHDRLFHCLQILARKNEWPLYAGMPKEAPVLIEPVRRGAKSISESLDDFIADAPSDTLAAVADALEKQLGVGPPEHGDVMDWDEARYLAQRGFELGAHTVGHTVLTLEGQPRVDEEIRQSKDAIARHTGARVRHFAYCNGWYSAEVVRSLVRHGFESAVTTEDFPNRIGGDPFALKRKVLWENFSLGAFGYSRALTACQLDDVFGVLGLTCPVRGWRLSTEPV